MPFTPTPVDVVRLLYTAKGRRERLRGRCPGDRFRAAMAILKLEKERMRGKWSLDCGLEVWAETQPDDDEPPTAPPPRQTEAPSRFVNTTRHHHAVAEPLPPLEPQFNRTILHYPAIGPEEVAFPPSPDLPQLPCRLLL